MRDIKFRAWIKKTGDMLFDVQNVQPVFGETFKDFLDNDYCEIMQYTGLTDKNGVEIFEGDIVSDGKMQDNHCLAGVHVVEFDDGGFHPFCVSGWEGTMDARYSEVIGNVYENPEMLTDTKPQS